jgi:hypothetical protein
LLVSFLYFFNKFVDHGRQQGDTAKAITQWWHPVASSEARDVLHRAIRPASYRLIRMATKIASNLRVFFVIVNSVIVDNPR